MNICILVSTAPVHTTLLGETVFFKSIDFEEILKKCFLVKTKMNLLWIEANHAFKINFQVFVYWCGHDLSLYAVIYSSLFSLKLKSFSTAGTYQSVTWGLPCYRLVDSNVRSGADIVTST